MSSYSMCPYVLCIFHSTRFWYKHRGFAVINIDIISYLVVKNVIIRFRPCWVYPVGWLIRCYGNASVESVSVGQMLYQPVGGDLCTNLLVVIC